MGGVGTEVECRRTETDRWTEEEIGTGGGRGCSGEKERERERLWYSGCLIG